MKPITAIILGAGQRGANVYGGYALNFPNELIFSSIMSASPSSRAQIAAPHLPRSTAFPKAAALQAGRTRSDRTNSQTVYSSVHKTGCTSSRSCRRWKRAMTCCAKSR